MTARKWMYLAALLLPLIALGTLSLRYAWHMNAAPSYHVVIEGYDPRDLVYGEYLQFRYRWDYPASEKPQGIDAALLPGTGRLYLPEGNARDLQQMMWERKEIFTVDARLMGKKAYAANLRAGGAPWQEALAAWRQNRDNQPR